MRISNCQHPTLITNPHTGEKVRVRCNKCSTCKNARAKNWVNRLIEERGHNKYSFMATLKYDNMHLPMLTTDELGNLVWKNRQLDLCIPFSDIDKVLISSVNPERERKYLIDRLNHRLSLPVLCFYDIQLFHKRLNKYIHDKITHTYENFRYFVVGEYGGATYRPHYHAIYFFNSRELAEIFPELIYKNWKNGSTSSECIFSNGGFSYVAQYVNMSSYFPAIYSLPALRQKHVFSKCPPIGSSKFLVQEIRDVYDRKPSKRVVYDSLSGKYTTLPVNTTFKNRFFPKCEGYSRRPYYDRIQLYRLAEIFPSGNFAEFVNEVYTVYCSLRGSKKILPVCYSGIYSWLNDLNMNSREMDKVEAKIYRSFLVSKRFLYIRDSLGVSSEFLASQIDDFYKKLDYERLKDFYDFQQNYVVKHSVSDLICCYPEFYDWFCNLKFRDETCISEHFKLALYSFDLDFDCVAPDICSTSDFLFMKSTHDNIYQSTHKAHDKNNYVHSKRLHDLDPELQKILIDYEA